MEAKQGVANHRSTIVNRIDPCIRMGALTSGRGEYRKNVVYSILYDFNYTHPDPADRVHAGLHLGGKRFVSWKADEVPAVREVVSRLFSQDAVDKEIYFVMCMETHLGHSAFSFQKKGSELGQNPREGPGRSSLVSRGSSP